MSGAREVYMKQSAVFNTETYSKYTAQTKMGGLTIIRASSLPSGRSRRHQSPDRAGRRMRTRRDKMAG